MGAVEVAHACNLAWCLSAYRLFWLRADGFIKFSATKDVGPVGLHASAYAARFLGGANLAMAVMAAVRLLQTAQAKLKKSETEGQTQDPQAKNGASKGQQKASHPDVALLSGMAVMHVGQWHLNRPLLVEGTQIGVRDTPLMRFIFAGDFFFALVNAFAVAKLVK